jgi:hypothetical protein
MSVEIDTRRLRARASDAQSGDFDAGPRWAEHVVTATGTMVAVLLASSIAVLMYLA